MGLDFRGQLTVSDVFGRSPRRTLLASVSGDMLAVGCREEGEGKRKRKRKGEGWEKNCLLWYHVRYKQEKLAYVQKV